ncbi:hypothetical protein [Streptomyces sp. NBC_01435]|uniref:hypothetical protein n=1 Tax=Streptomyces sp. NBC_01435 TaxID=2903865 RepID=UPI002E2FA743|nr:hypothetical protein [Streptomyces sp. NBC_01435]
MADNMSIAQQLLAALHRLNMADYDANPAGQPVVRLTIRSMDGEPVGELQLGQRAVEEAITAVSAVAEYAVAKPADYQAGRNDHASTLDPLLVAAIEDHFAKVDPESYLADVFSGPDAEASVAAYDQLVTGEWDGEL